MARNPTDSAPEKPARPRTPRIAWLALIMAAAIAAWFGAVWVVNFVIRANQAGG